MHVAEIAQKLGVAYWVEGSVRKGGDEVRIAAQLVKAAEGCRVGSDTFARELKDVVAVQDEIAGTVAKRLEATLAGHASASVSIRSPSGCGGNLGGGRGSLRSVWPGRFRAIELHDGRMGAKNVPDDGMSQRRFHIVVTLVEGLADFCRRLARAGA